jgi:hypothetical protein
MALKKCKECGKEISTQAKACPSCGAPNTNSNFKYLFIFFGIFCLISAISNLFKDDNPDRNKKPEKEKVYFKKGKFEKYTGALPSGNVDYYVMKKNGTYDQRPNDLEEMCKDWQYYRNLILEKTHAGDAQGATEARNSFNKINFTMSAEYNEEDIQKMFVLIGQIGYTLPNKDSGESSKTTIAQKQAATESLDLMGLKPGMSFPEVEQIVEARLVPDRWKGITSKNLRNHHSCSRDNNESLSTKGWKAVVIEECTLQRDSIPYGGTEILGLYFVDNTLAEILWGFNRAQFNEVAELLIKKYAGRSKLERTQTQFEWSNGISTVHLYEHLSDQSGVVVKHDTLSAEFDRRKSSTTPKSNL